MAYIYKISNDINHKVYIGKTQYSLEKRFKEHCKDAFKRGEEKRPLYNAMQKYGVEHFFIELIEETEYPEEREKYWIEQYDSYKNGYNATLGGDGAPYLDYEYIADTFKKIGYCTKTAEICNCSVDSVEYIVNKMNLQNYFSKANINSKSVDRLDKQGNYIDTFSSAYQAALYLGKITNTSNGATGHIADVCKGRRQIAYGYKWKYSDEII